ncbi:MAG: VWA domain-containing protein [bacterium]|nr:VWA domain-containing protein [bacterium]
MNWIGAGAAIIVLLVLVSTLRTRLELRQWLGADPLRYRRWLRALAFSATALLLGRALHLAATTPPALSGSGADVVLMMDVSRSMDARDTPPSRLRRAVRTAEHLIKESQGMRMGLVIFSGEAFVALPLTQDRDALLTYVRALDSETISVRGSDLERGLRIASRTFDPHSNRPRRIVLLSDGEHAGSGIGNTVSRLKGMGIRVVAVGFGTPEGAVVPLPGGGNLETREGSLVRSRRDDTLLRRIARTSGGLYFREFQDRPSPGQILPAPDEPQETEVPERTDVLSWLLLAASLALISELLLSSRVRALRTAGAKRRSVSAIAAVAAGLLAAGPLNWLDDGDTLLEDGQAREALSLYRRAERTSGASTASRIRVGNAQYRLGRMNQAAAAYLDALRILDRDDHAARFSASFNLGNTLLSRQRYREAYDAFWTAVLANPDSIEAKYNYEWAGALVEPDPPLPDFPQPPSRQPSSQASQSDDADGSGKGERAAPRPGGGLSQSDAERWMRTIDESLSDALQSQISREYGGQNSSRGRGQNW